MSLRRSWLRFRGTCSALRARAAPAVRATALLDDQSDEHSFAGLPPFGGGVDVGLIDPERVSRWKQGSREVWTWTVKDLAQMRRALGAGVDGLITDTPGEVLKHL